MRIFLKTIFLLGFAVMAGSCSKVQFGTTSGSGTGVTTASNSITCNVFFNSSATSVTVTSQATNPTVTANCTPTNVSLVWTVTNSSGGVVTVQGLAGSSSTGDFYSLGNGVYTVTLTASASGYTSYTSGPLTATVQVPTATQSVSCTPEINGSTAAITLTPSSTEPTITANCTPTGVSYVWTVTSNGASVTVPGLSGSSSIPNFLSMTTGTYNIYLQASTTGYNAYQSTTPLVVTVNQGTTTAMNYSTTVTAQNNLLDIMLIIDDSNSMLANNQKLAAKLKNLVDNVTAQGFNWQMCVTVTRAVQVTSTDPTLYWGASVNWVGFTGSPGYVLTSGTANVDTIFMNTINQIGAGWADSEDERPLKAAWWSLYYGDYHYAGASGCYRQDAGLAVVMISNEDERSIGGDKSQQYYSNEYFPLDDDDTPSAFVTQVQTVFGANKRFTWNSVVVRPSDATCMATQDAQGTKSHYGVVNTQIASMSNGYIGSICDSDFTSSMNTFANQIITQMNSASLSCTPVGALSVTVSPNNASYSYSVTGNIVTFSPAVPVGSTIQIQYNCQ